jgi:general nucleoside transport system permease protein
MPGPEVLGRLRAWDTWSGVVTSLAAVALALAVSMAVIAGFGGPPLDALRNLWIGAFGSTRQLAGTLSYVTPLTLVAAGWILVASVGRISVGFDGQILIGGVFATWVGVSLAGLAGPVHLALGIVLAMLAGAAWAGIAAWLWAVRHVNEIIATLLLNLIAFRIVGWLVRGPLQEPTGGFSQSEPLLDSARWPALVPNTPLAADSFLALALVALLPFVLRGTGFGYRLRLTGANGEAARHAGIDTRRVTVTAIVLSGALGGLAGSSLILAGQTGVMTDGFNQNLGFYGIVVALLARNVPLATLPAALLIAALLQGGPFMQAQVGISSALMTFTQGLVVVFVAGSVVLLRRRRPGGGRAALGLPADTDQPRPVEVS